MNKTKLTLFMGLALLPWCLVQAAGHWHSGIIGQVFIGPTCPVIRPGLNCADRPFQTGISIYSKKGKFITRFRTDVKGQFEVRLKHGRYVVVPEGAGSSSLPFVAALEVIVEKREFTPVVITYDSGIR